MSSQDPQDTNNIRRLPSREERTSAAEPPLPGSYDAERGVLGCILESAREILPQVRPILLPDDFSHTPHRVIYQVILDMVEHGDPVDVATVPIEIHRRGKLADVEDIGYVMGLVNGVQSPYDGAYFARIVKDASIARQAISFATTAAALGYDNVGGAKILASLEQMVTQMRERGGQLTARRFGIVSDLELEQLRPLKGILGSWIRDQEIVAIYGAAESYKSFLAISMGECWATGTDWFGMPVEQRTVLYIAAEAPGTIGDRVAAWKQHHGLAGQRTEFYTSTLPVDLTSSEEVTALISEIRECLPDAPGAVIIDTYACATSGEEKDAASVNAAYRGMRMLRDAFGATIVYVDHEGKDRERGQTGSQRKKDNADVQMHVELIQGSEGMTVHPAKMKAGAKPTPLTLQIHPVSFYNAQTQEMRSSLVLLNTGKAEARAASNEARAERLSRRQRQALDALTDLPEGRAAYGDWWRACHNGDPKNFPKRTFDDARAYLLKARLVEVSDDIYVSLVRNKNRTSASAPLRTSAVGAGGIYTPAPHRTKEAEMHGGEDGDAVVVSEEGQTAPYHRHNPKTMYKRDEGIVACDDCHPRQPRGA